MIFPQIFILFYYIITHNNVAVGIKCWSRSNNNTAQQMECPHGYDTCAISSCGGHIKQQCFNGTMDDANWQFSFKCLQKYGPMVRDNRYKVCEEELCNEQKILPPMEKPFKCYINDNVQKDCTLEAAGCFVLNLHGALKRGCLYSPKLNPGEDLCPGMNSYECKCIQCYWKDGCNEPNWMLDPELDERTRTTTRSPYTWRTTTTPWIPPSAESNKTGNEKIIAGVFALLFMIFFGFYACKKISEREYSTRTRENNWISQNNRMVVNVESECEYSNRNRIERPILRTMPTAPPIYSIHPTPTNPSIQQNSFKHEESSEINQNIRSNPVVDILPQNNTTKPLPFECTICMLDGSKREMIFEPCAHVVCCQQCAMKISRCPMCQSEIETMKKVYLS